jgi:NADH-quinone oxidoreductase subunit A
MLEKILENYTTFNNSLIYIEYTLIFNFLLLAIILASLIIFLSYLLAVQNPDTEKLSTYECGFEPYEDARNTFDVKYYLIAILFIIFDIETMYLFPWSIAISKTDILAFWSMIDFIIELGVGFIYIWVLNALEWN